MKNYEKGFIAPFLIMAAAVLLVGGGTYLYIKNIKPDFSNNTDKQKTAVQKKATVQQKTTQNLKVFTQADGIYSLSYPSSWRYSEGQLGMRFTTDKGESIDLGVGSDSNTFIQTLISTNASHGATARSEKVTVKSNTFTKYTISAGSRFFNDVYILPIGAPAYFSVIISGVNKPSQDYQDDIDLVLGNIKIDSSKVSAISSRQANTSSTSQIKANVANMRNGAATYFNLVNTYVGICEGKNETAKTAMIDKIMESILKNVPATNIYCKASNDAFVFSVRTLDGDIICSDSTGFTGKIDSSAKALSCK